MYRAVTREIQVTVTPSYLEEQSSPRKAASSGPTRSRSSISAPRPCSCARATGTSATARAASRRCAATAWSASSRGSGRASASNTRAAARSRPRRASWTGSLRRWNTGRRQIRGGGPRLFARQPARPARHPLTYACVAGAIRDVEPFACGATDAPGRANLIHAVDTARHPRPPRLLRHGELALEPAAHRLRRGACSRGQACASSALPNAAGDKAAIYATIGPCRTAASCCPATRTSCRWPGQAWTSDPFTLRVADGRAYGRGAVDMKGFAAIVLSHDPGDAAGGACAGPSTSC